MTAQSSGIHAALRRKPQIHTQTTQIIQQPQQLKKRKKQKSIRKTIFQRQFQLQLRNDDIHMSTWTTTIQKKRIQIQKQNKNHTLDQRMQKLPSTRILQQNTKI